MKPWIGVLLVSCRIYDVGSLKDRRQIVRSLIERTKRHYNASVADLGPDGVWDAADIAVTCAGSSHQETAGRIDQIASFFEKNEADGEFEIVSAHREVFSYGDI